MTSNRRAQRVRHAPVVGLLLTVWSLASFADPAPRITLTAAEQRQLESRVAWAVTRERLVVRATETSEKAADGIRARRTAVEVDLDSDAVTDLAFKQASEFAPRSRRACMRSDLQCTRRGID